MEPCEDRISNLPDDILCHILSFNPTKNAVTTSILSKRWTHLWRCVPILDFTDIKLRDCESILLFNQFVDYFMLSREATGNHSIDSFIVDVEYAASRNHVTSLSIPNLAKWVNLVVQRKVKNLHLLLNLLNDPIPPGFLLPKLPNTIFSCKTLVTLRLSWFHVKGFSFSSVGFGFPLLKTLHLDRVMFVDEREILLLLDGCPVLQDFKSSDVYTSNVVTEESINQVFHNLSLSKLIRADIIDVNCDIPMKALFNSEFLRIQLWEAYTPYDLPTFNNLTHLVINYYLDMFIEVLHHCPKLQILELYQKTQVDWDEENTEGGKEQENWVDPKSTPQFLSLYLRTCTIRDFAFVDLQHDLMLARYILNNARVLQTMTIWSDKEQPQIEKELSLIPMASKTCQLSVY
ncbi:putative F-box domain, FBD domain, leucine-rich repeat domain, L domain-containing protein [Medicago truncatula]|uniref:Putative F-box domain, FBD domain, leucine-rich repeat domain, L domain-containing protein n=1 Tax=Medicago truncatula TaxID=3880 RepID=A0A396HZ55_MEDTR|nr:F-box/FBD/LRR-repeat protein At4g00160 [Medicago truncatula]RHN57224.1 putative F-box domain, FBD domain, leucine-rich repeat domain, L domain-containing protein [Medicago truncatula]